MSTSNTGSPRTIELSVGQFDATDVERVARELFDNPGRGSGYATIVTPIMLDGAAVTSLKIPVELMLRPDGRSIAVITGFFGPTGIGVITRD